MSKTEYLKADMSFFSVFRELIDNGTLAEVGVYSWAVYTVIKSYSGYNTGESFPSVQTIAAKSGISEIQVKRSLKQLEEKGLLTKRKEGRHNVYSLNETLTISDQNHQAVATASFSYVPSKIKDSLAELRDVLLAGDLQGTKTIHIEHLQLNIINNTANGQSTIINNPTQEASKDPRESWEALKEKLVSKKQG